MKTIEQQAQELTGQWYENDSLNFTDIVTKALQERESLAIENERIKWLNQTLVSQYVHLQWDGEKITEYYLDEVDYEHLDDQHTTVEEDVTTYMKGKSEGSYSIKIVKYFVEGQMSHPETGQWDFSPYYELSAIYYKNDTSSMGYKVLKEAYA